MKDLLDEYFRLRKKKQLLAFVIRVFVAIAIVNLLLTLFSVSLPLVYLAIIVILNFLVAAGYIWVCYRIDQVVSRLEEQVGPVEPYESPLRYYRWSERENDAIDIEAVSSSRE